MFFKKSPSIRKLVKQCNHKHDIILKHLNEASSEDYYEFKISLAKDFFCLRDRIESCAFPKEAIALLLHFQEQLNFLVEHPFFASEQDLKNFLEHHYPYNEKIIDVVASCHSHEKEFSSCVFKKTGY